MRDKKMAKEKKKENDIAYWNIPVPKLLNEALETLIKRNGYRTKTEFIRGLVRKELEMRGFHPPIKTEEKG